MCAPGRSADEEFLRLQGFPYVSASDVALEGRPNPPRPLTQEEIVEFIGMFATAARNAVEKAGFDGVESVKLPVPLNTLILLGPNIGCMEPMGIC